MGKDGFIKSGMVASAILRIVGALGRSEICKCLFSDRRGWRHSDGQWEVLSVLQCTFDVKGGFGCGVSACNVPWILTLGKGPAISPPRFLF